jgi:hypothetical protein
LVVFYLADNSGKENSMVSKNNTHLVLKNDEVRKYCTEMQIAQLSGICESISNGRMYEGKPLNTYFVVNTDEPYADSVFKIIKQGEDDKDPENRRTAEMYRGEYA